ncbi:TlpA family protein disulfide reductase [Shimia marina]|uniref:Cytochrome c biogenesis protein TlpA n=1 Tax=Shimia marina TaxID=321267 RepID=A0A0P1EV49_9RHOB|nr:TlpA disulfide reductase family protein [Shimia marina]CUH54266.1 Cytochrome c biogenesis protein TlpA [Shimia marina]SFD98972.1 Thiol-disulfide isomerase or thioredoxin [Shimia marina]
MKRIRSASVYTGLAAIAIAAMSFVTQAAPAFAEATDYSAVKELREGDMRKLIFHAEPKEISEISFITGDEGNATLQDYDGKVVLLNFWATWCAPCRHEMPMLSELQEILGGEDFEVVTIATGRNMVPAMVKFFEEIEVTNLPLHRDPKGTLARDMRVLGLPATVLLDRNGKEIARLHGDADWSSENARAIVAEVINVTATQKD